MNARIAIGNFVRQGKYRSDGFFSHDPLFVENSVSALNAAGR